jgi:uncharacterized protein YjbJ (UPF0337 family)
MANCASPFKKQVEGHAQQAVGDIKPVAKGANKK